MVKNLFNTMFKKKDLPKDEIYLVAQLNDKIMPIDRGIIYEDPLDECLREKQIGEVTGSGTLQEKTGELCYCDIEIKLSGRVVDMPLISDIIGKLEQLGAPKGSKLIIESTEEEIPFGKLEGLAIYLDGQNLPDEVYAECDINFVLTELHRLTDIEPNADRNWQRGKRNSPLLL